MTKKKQNEVVPTEITRRLLVDIVRGKAFEFGLDPALICAIVEQESDWNPWAFRFEASFYRMYVAPLYTMEKLKNDLTELQARATSWGLFQCMGQTAREHGFEGKYLTELCQPNVGAEIGCKIFRAKLDAEHGRVEEALLRWNGGANKNYPSEVLARKGTYETGTDKPQEEVT